MRILKLAFGSLAPSLESFETHTNSLLTVKLFVQLICSLAVAKF